MSQEKWADLPQRFTSAVVMLIIFAAALYLGLTGILLLGFVGVLAMQWELARMFGVSGRRLLAVISVAVLGWLPMVVQPGILFAGMTLPAVAGFLPIMIGAALVKQQRGIYVGYGALLTLGMVGFWHLALNFGSFGIAILAAVVILSDIGGYIAGRMIGGAKFLFLIHILRCRGSPFCRSGGSADDKKKKLIRRLLSNKARLQRI